MLTATLNFYAILTVHQPATVKKLEIIGKKWCLEVQNKGSCERLMDEFILVPLFQNESWCETFYIKRVRLS